MKANQRFSIEGLLYKQMKGGSIKMKAVIAMAVVFGIVVLLVSSHFAMAAPIKTTEIKKIEMNNAKKVKAVVEKPQRQARVDKIENYNRKGDINHDGKIDEKDLDLLLTVYGLTKEDMSPYFWQHFGWYADFNDDAVINLSDLGEMLSRL